MLSRYVMNVLYGLSAILAVSAQACLLAVLLRQRRSLAATVHISTDTARLHLEWSALLTEVLAAAQDEIALCPACHLGVGDECRCEGRRRRLALAVTAVEDFASAHASETDPPARPA